jgi:hypothetical protein
MITELTPEQEILLQKRKEEWLNIGLSTYNNEELAEKTITEMYALMNLPKPKFIWSDSPKGIAQEYEKITGEKFKKEFNFWGSLDAYWVSFYSFCEEIGVKYEEKDSHLLSLWKDLCLSCFWWYPFENACFVSRKPTEINMVNGRLHNENGPSVKFLDGFKIYSLNGVSVDEWIVKTPAEDIATERMLGEENVEVRQELIRKIGGKRVVTDLKLKTLESMTGEELYNKYPVGNYYQQGDVWFGTKKLENLGTGIDKCGNATQVRLIQGVFYKLYSGDVKGIPIKILHMGNPSVTGDEHFEFVAEHCESIIKAIGFRNQHALRNASIDWENDEILLPYELS